VVEKAYDFLLWLLPKVQKFPRSFRFTVGDRTVNVGLDLLLALVEAAYSTDKGEPIEISSRRWARLKTYSAQPRMPPEESAVARMWRGFC
jgi:hypothetical protein